MWHFNRVICMQLGLFLLLFSSKFASINYNYLMYLEIYKGKIQGVKSNHLQTLGM